MPRFWKRLREKLPNADPRRNSNVHVPFPSSVPIESVPDPEPAPNCETDIEPKRLQGRLWNEAYDLLKSNNAELVESYEKILSRDLLRDHHESSESAPLENRIDGAYGQRWKQMQAIVEASLERRKEKAATQQKVGSGLAIVSTTMSQAVRAVPEAAVAWAGISFALGMVSNSVQEAKSNNQGIVYVVSRMDWYWHLAELLSDDNNYESAPVSLRLQIEKHVLDLYQKLLLYQMKSVCRYYRHHGPAVLRDSIKADDWTGQLDDIRNAEAIVQEDSRILNALEIQKRLGEIESASQVIQSQIQDTWSKIQEHNLSKEEERCLKDLRITDPRDDKARIEDTNGGLLQGAYGWALNHDDFIAWRQEKTNHMLWVKGDPGKGKTMLLCGIIDELQRQNVKPCYFFCQATDPRLNNATAILRGLIYLLVDTNRQLLSHMQEKYDQAGAVLFEDVNSWVVLSQVFTKLLDDPMLDDQIFMIDALDECQTDLERLLDLIIGNSSNSRAKWLVSSRNWIEIEAKFGKIPQKIRFSLELNEQSVSEAVNFFIAHKTAQLKETKELDDKTELIVREFLSDHARGTFLWVALVCKELSKLTVRKRHIAKKMAEFPSDLVPLYKRMMQQIRDSEDSELCERIVRLVAVVYRPVTLAELASLLDVVDKLEREDLEEIVASCGSFLVVRDDVVRFVHQSARDFLLKDEIRDSELGNLHYALFSRSLSILSETLRRDMYNLRHPGALLEEYTPNQDDEDVLRHAQYSCVYWVDHLKTVNDSDRDKCVLSLQENGIIHHFLRHKLLYWLEALSLLKKTPEAAKAVGILKKLTINDESTMRKLIEDVNRFVFSHKAGFELAPLQVYSSAIVFSPGSSVTRQMYEEAEGPKWVIIKPEMPVEWTARIQSFDLRDSLVVALKFSPDGTQLASGLSHGIVKVWDLGTGACLHTFQCPFTASILLFSPHGKHLATGSSYENVKIWDLTTATCLYTFEGAAYVEKLAFSLDGAQLATSSTDRLRLGGSSIRTWDIITGKESKTHDLGANKCKAVAFTPDGTLLACVMDRDTRVLIWNSAMCKSVHLYARFGEHGRLGNPFAFSADAARLAVVIYADHNEEVRIFDTSIGTCLLKIHDNLASFTEVMFLAAPTRLVSRSGGRNYKIWDPVTGSCLHGMLIASADYNIRLWDVAIGSFVTNNYDIDIGATALSPDGTQLAIAPYSSRKGPVEIRDPVTGSCLKRLDHRRGEHIYHLLFFPDGKRLASQGLNVHIWSVSSGMVLHTIDLEAGSSSLSCLVAISSDGNLVAAKLSRTHIGIWNSTTGEILQKTGEDLGQEIDHLEAMAFSSNNDRLALTLGNGTVHIYNVNSGALVKLLRDFFMPIPWGPHQFVRHSQIASLIFDDERSVIAVGDEDWDANAFGRQDSVLSVKALSPQPISTSKHLQSACTFTVSHTGTWILRGQRRVLWLPPEYRPWRMEVNGGLVICISKNEKLVRFQFDVEELDKVLV